MTVSLPPRPPPDPVAAEAVAMRDPNQLKRWLRESGRTWLVLRTDDLVDALRWPDGVETLIDMISAYSKLRAATRPPVDRPGGVRLADDRLELEELDALIEMLQGLRAAAVRELQPVTPTQ